MRMARPQRREHWRRSRAGPKVARWRTRGHQRVIFIDAHLLADEGRVLAAGVGQGAEGVAKTVELALRARKGAVRSRRSGEREKRPSGAARAGVSTSGSTFSHSSTRGRLAFKAERARVVGPPYMDSEAKGNILSRQGAGAAGPGGQGGGFGFEHPAGGRRAEEGADKGRPASPRRSEYSASAGPGRRTRPAEGDRCQKPHSCT